MAIPRRALFFLKCAALALAAWFVYAPVFHGDWLWDDNTDVTGNSLLRDPSGLGKIWFAPGSAAYLPLKTGAQSWVAAPTLDYYPLKNSVQWVQWHWWGMDTFGYHLTNVALHLLSAFLLWDLLRRILAIGREPLDSTRDIRVRGLAAGHERRPTAGVEWLGGLLFAVHPVAVESVAWIVELKNTLSLPLLLLAMTLFVVSDDELKIGKAENRKSGKRVGAYWLAWTLFLAAMLCKTSVVMFPVVILLFAWWRRGRVGRRDVWGSVPFFAVSLVLGLVSIALHHRGEASSGIVIAGGLWSRIAGAGLALVFYLWKCLFPVGLAPIYHRWSVDPPSPAQFLPWLAIAVLGAWLWAKRETYGRHVLFGLGFFALNLAPVLGLVRASFMSLTWVMDHFAYISLIGVIGLAVAGLGALYNLNREAGVIGEAKPELGSEDRTSPLSPASLFKSVFWIVVLALVIALAVESRGYARVFSSGEGLWTYALRHNPDAWVAESNLASVLADKGRLPEAIVHYRRSLRLRPDNPEARNNLGNALLQTGATAEAIAQYQEALRLKPDYFDSLANLGNALADTGRTAEAVERLTAASRLQPDNAELHNNLGCALAQMGRTEEARRQFEDALRLKPGDAGVKANLELLRAR